MYLGPSLLTIENYRLKNQKPLGTRCGKHCGGRKGSELSLGVARGDSGIPPLHLPATEACILLGLLILIRKMGMLVLRIFFFFFLKIKIK